MAQAVHAAVECALEHPDRVRGAPTVVVLGSPDELRLTLLADELDDDELVRFYEPDLPPSELYGDLSSPLTAIALVSEGHRLLDRLPLLLRDPRGGET